MNERERERERETYEWEEEKIVMDRKKNIFFDGGGSSSRQGVLRGRERYREWALWGTMFCTEWGILIPLFLLRIWNSVKLV